MVKKKNKNVLFEKAKLADGSNFTNPAVEGLDKLELYKTLKLTVKQLSEIFQLYLANDMTKLIELLTPEYYAILSTRLYSLKKSKSKYPEFEVIRETFTETLTGLNVALMRNSELSNIKSQRDQYKESYDILNDTQLLEEYLESLKTQYTSVFGDVKDVKLNISAGMNPEYKEYIRVHGLPNNGVFEPDKLGEIIIRLGL